MGSANELPEFAFHDAPHHPSFNGKVSQDANSVPRKSLPEAGYRKQVFCAVWYEFG
ncbi:hypothetical protein VT84_26685 [Gemmata sp. SH-PL17]|nr:hypothetical protein VT84_26685 [Gemmata sp. SH-PL17]